jgi:uncharacterized protein
MTTREDILKILEARSESIKKFGVREIGVFGSFARGDQKETSDVDVLVELDRPKYRNYMGLLEFLESTFGRKVDLVMKGSIKPLIKKRILRETIYVPGF